MKQSIIICLLGFFWVSSFSQPFQPKPKTKAFITKYTGYTAEIPKTSGHAKEKFTWIKWEPQSSVALVLKIQSEIDENKNAISSTLVSFELAPYAKDQLFEVFDENKLKKNGGSKNLFFLQENHGWKCIYTIHGYLYAT